MNRTLFVLAVGSMVSLSVDTVVSQTPPGVVSHVSVVSDKVPNVSSMKAWKRAFIREGMSDREKGLAIWRSVVAFHHQDAPPNEMLHGENNVHDPIKTFNVYGYGMCCCKASNVEALARYVGLETRGRIIRAHSVPEVYWDDAWHLLDTSLINYMPKADGKLASVDEILAGVKAWYDEHPDYRNNDGKLRQFMGGGGWRSGPEVLARVPFYDDNGWLPAATHGWYSTMQEYDGSANGVYEYGYSQGYQVNVQLRRGERLTRNWFNQGLHVNMQAGDAPGCLNKAIGTEDLRYTPAYGDMAPGRVGNGTREYCVPLADGGFRDGALSIENLACTADDGQAPAMHVRDATRPGELVLRMPSSYVYLSGLLEVRSQVSSGGSIRVELSDNNGLDWREVATITSSDDHSIDLGPLVFRRYDYRLRLVLAGTGTGVDRLRLVHDIQHSQRALPALGEGTNTITFSAGPQEGTVTIDAGSSPEKAPKQLVLSDFQPVLKGVKGHLMRVEGGEGEFTMPIETPSEMVRLRFGCHYRARDDRDGWDMSVSFDEGKTFTKAARCEGPTPGSCKYVVIEDIPAGARSARVRWSGTQRNTTCLFNLRIDADYREPHGGFTPVKITYTWVENGQVKRDVHIARTPDEVYTIECKSRPAMKSIVLELAD